MTTIKSRKENGVDIITVLEKRIFLDTSDKFKQDLLKVLEGGAKNVVFDLSHVKIMNSSGLGVLILARDRLKDRGGQMAVCNLQPLMEEIFERMQFHAFFQVKKTLEEALKAVSGP